MSTFTNFLKKRDLLVRIISSYVMIGLFFIGIFRVCGRQSSFRKFNETNLMRIPNLR